jgi:hypothetical protein
MDNPTPRVYTELSFQYLDWSYLMSAVLEVFQENKDDEARPPQGL